MKLQVFTSILLLQYSLAYGLDPVAHNPPSNTSASNFTITLDQYLQSKSFTLSPTHSKINEGYLSNAQQEQFRQQLAQHPHIKSIAEIGLNAGHSAENFFQSCKNIEKFVSFDINMHAYTRHAAEYLQAKYKDRFIFVPGDSKLKVLEVAQLCTQEKDKFDLIYIDGDHTYNGCRIDIENCKKLAHKNTILWIDDCKCKKVAKAISRCEKRGIIQVINVHESRDQSGKRSWAQARYLF